MGGVPVRAGMWCGSVCEREAGGARGISVRGVTRRWRPRCVSGGHDTLVGHGGRRDAMKAAWVAMGVVGARGHVGAG